MCVIMVIKITSPSHYSVTSGGLRQECRRTYIFPDELTPFEHATITIAGTKYRHTISTIGQLFDKKYY